LPRSQIEGVASFSAAGTRPVDHYLTSVLAENVGTLLAERGEAAPIILDDALVYCDDDRIERMFDALSRAGKSQQIIVLTCHLRSFGQLLNRLAARYNLIPPTRWC
jgi:hypothetical protein